MTRPVCEARTAAWQRMAAEGIVDPDRRAIPCPRPDGCGATAGEECREPACCGKCGGYLTGEEDRCVCDATPAIDVSALLATLKTLGILLRVTEGESIEDAARRVSRRADEQGLALTRLRRALGARDGESVEDAAGRTAKAHRDAEATVRHLRDREECIIAACERVADGGQYRADIVSAIQTIRRHRDEARTVVASLLSHILTRGACQWHREHDPKCADCAVFAAARAMGGGR